MRIPDENSMIADYVTAKGRELRIESGQFLGGSPQNRERRGRQRIKFC
jgi:hypothetical protein